VELAHASPNLLLIEHSAVNAGNTWVFRCAAVKNYGPGLARHVLVEVSVRTKWRRRLIGVGDAIPLLAPNETANPQVEGIMPRPARAPNMSGYRFVEATVWCWDFGGQRHRFVHSFLVETVAAASGSIPLMIRPTPVVHTVDSVGWLKFTKPFRRRSRRR
jgi:hypothetical protein